MSDDQIIAIVSIGATIFGGLASVWLNHLLSSRKKTSLDHYEMVEKLVGTRDISTTHDLLLETQFQSLYKRQTEAPVIRFLLSCSYPLRRIIQYKNGRSYLEKRMGDDGKVVGFNFGRRIKNKKTLKWLFRGLIAAYALIMFGTIYPLVTYKFQIEQFVAQVGYQLLFPLGTLVLSAFWFAFMALVEAMSVSSAIEFVEAIEQENNSADGNVDHEERT